MCRSLIPSSAASSFTDRPLSAPAAINSAARLASLGTASTEALEINATTVAQAVVTGTGVINLTDSAGGVTVTTATTAVGNIMLNAVGGNLTLGTVTAGTAASAVWPSVVKI